MTHSLARHDVRLIVVTILVAPLLVSTAMARAGALSIEENIYHVEVTPFDFGENYNQSVAIPYFDTLGGTRQLEEVWFEWQITVNWEALVASPTVDSNGQFQWTTDWSAELPNGLSVPTSGAVSLLTDYWLANDANAPSYFQSGTSSIYGNQTVTNAAYLSTVTGSGSYQLEHHLTISPISVFDPNEPGFVFDPNIAEVFGLSIFVDGTVEYRYSTIPAPASLAFLGLAFARSARRRRHS